MYDPTIMNRGIQTKLLPVDVRLLLIDKLSVCLELWQCCAVNPVFLAELTIKVSLIRAY
jgi:hypothetical protein